MNKLIIMLFAIAYTFKLSAQDQRIINFYATSEGVVGHAFVSFVRSDSGMQQTIREGTWGMYPVAQSDVAKGFFIGEVPGIIRDDIATRIELGFAVSVTQAEYEMAKAIKNDWASKNYQLTQSDCISFVESIAKSLSHKIHVPERRLFDTPVAYIEAIKVLNKQPVVCPGQNELVENYDKKDPNYHIYTHVGTICDTSIDPCCNELLVYNIMKKSAHHTAPYAGSGSVTDCGKIKLPVFGIITTKLNSSPYSITNYTNSDHILHKGKVTRYVIRVGTEIKVYTVGLGINKNQFYAWLNKNQLNVEAVWGLMVNRALEKAVAEELDIICPKGKSSTLFLFDLSGSMNDNGGGTIPKLEQAKQASQSSLRALSANNQGVQNQVAVYGFAGGCVPDPTYEFSPFDTNLAAVEQRILQMRAGGGTPLGNAIRAAECKMAAHLRQTGQEKGKLILLSDGQGTCGPIRPAGVYNSAPLQHRDPMIIDAKQCGLPPGKPLAVSYYTVGFNIPAGSPAERDLQYLSQSSRGKYLNVQNQTQLTRAFRKFNRVYRPKMNPATDKLSPVNQSNFKDGVNVILDERFSKALVDWEALAFALPDDCHVIYNLALAQEANDLYREAITNYRLYLNLCPSPDDELFVKKQIDFLEEEFRQFVAFQRDVIQSDLAFMELHFKQIQNGQSVRLAAEFKGFLQEKGDFYERLPRMLASKNRFLKSLAEDIASSLKRAAKLINRNPESWDRDATPVISMTYLNLKDLAEEI